MWGGTGREDLGGAGGGAAGGALAGLVGELVGALAGGGRPAPGVAKGLRTLAGASPEAARVAAGVLAELCLSQKCAQRRGRGAPPAARRGLLAAGDALLGPGSTPTLALAGLDAGLVALLWHAHLGGGAVGIEQEVKFLSEFRDSARGWRQSLGDLHNGAQGDVEKGADRYEKALSELEDVMASAEAALLELGQRLVGGVFPAGAASPAAPTFDAEEEAAHFQAALRDEVSELYAAVKILEAELGPGSGHSALGGVTSEAAGAAIKCQAAYPTVRGIIRECHSRVGRPSVKESVSPNLLSELMALKDRIGFVLHAFGRAKGGVWAMPPSPAPARGPGTPETASPNRQRVAQAASEIEAFLSEADLPPPPPEGLQIDSQLLLDYKRVLEGLQRDRGALREKVRGLQRAFECSLSELKEDLVASLSEADMVRGRWMNEINERKRLHESLQVLKGNVRVRCRIRPLKASEDDPVVFLAGSYFGDRENVLVTEAPSAAHGVGGYRGKHLGAGRRGSGGEQSFRFDTVFGPEATNAEVYGDVSELVVSALEGYNVCVFAYGQTGSGKTHSIIGSGEDPGIVVRAVSDLFQAAIERRECGLVYDFGLSVKEIYQDKVYDLLNDDLVQLDVKMDPESGMPSAPGEVIVDVETSRETIDLISRGARLRSTAKTIMNACSSRSHLLTTVLIRCLDPKTGRETRSKLHICDLAGSERISRSGASGTRKEEAIKINVSLLALSEVMSALGSNKGHVPYRRSKLTFLLQDSLSGSAKTVMLVNLSPSSTCREETLCSLNFAQRVARVELGRATQQVALPGSRRSRAP